MTLYKNDIVAVLAGMYIVRHISLKFPLSGWICSQYFAAVSPNLEDQLLHANRALQPPQADGQAVVPTPAFQNGAQRRILTPHVLP